MSTHPPTKKQTLIAGKSGVGWGGGGDPVFARVILLINARSGSGPSSALPTQAERNLNKGLRGLHLQKPTDGYWRRFTRLLLRWKTLSWRTGQSQPGALVWVSLDSNSMDSLFGRPVLHRVHFPLKYCWIGERWHAVFVGVSGEKCCECNILLFQSVFVKFILICKLFYLFIFFWCFGLQTFLIVFTVHGSSMWKDFFFFFFFFYFEILHF